MNLMKYALVMIFYLLVANGQFSMNKQHARDNCDRLFQEIESNIREGQGLYQAICTSNYDVDCVNQMLGFAGAAADQLEKTKYPRGLGFGSACQIPDPVCDRSINWVLHRLNETTTLCVCVFFHSFCSASFPDQCEKDVVGLIKGYRDRKLDVSFGAGTQGPKVEVQTVPEAYSRDCKWNGPIGFRPFTQEDIMEASKGSDRWDKMNSHLQSSNLIVGIFNSTTRVVEVTTTEPNVPPKSSNLVQGSTATRHVFIWSFMSLLLMICIVL